MARKKTNLTAEAEGALLNLRAFYVENRRKARDVKTRVKDKYQDIIEEETAREVQKIDREFAEALARVKATHNVPITKLMDEVLRSRSWDRWETWRDLAGLPDETTLVNEEKARVRASNRPYRLEEGEWYAIRNEEGDIDPIRLDILEKKDGFAIWPPMDEQDHGYDSYVKNFGRNQKRFNDFIVTAFKKYGDDPFERGA